MALIFPALPGLAWSVTKSPTFQTRIQRAVSGRELRALDYPYPLWQFTLVFDFLRDNPAAGYNELRTLMGFFMLCQGAFGNFVFNDPTDNSVTFQTLPAAVSTLTGTVVLAGAGTAYTVGDIVSPAGGTISRDRGRPDELERRQHFRWRYDGAHHWIDAAESRFLRGGAGRDECPAHGRNGKRRAGERLLADASPISQNHGGCFVARHRIRRGHDGTQCC
jgi:hypothetical protein